MAATRARSDRPANWAHSPRWHVALLAAVFALYLVAVIAGATTSSLAMGHLMMDPNGPTDHWNQVQALRSDEYNAGTPVQLSMLATGGEPTMSPLSADASLVHRYPIGVAQNIVFWDTWLFRLGHVLPQQCLFAAHWWLPTLLVLVCMPTWFFLMGSWRQFGWLAAGLIVVQPNNFWWSMQPTMQLAFTLAGCTAMLAAEQRLRIGHRWRGIGLIVVAGVCIAGMPSNYFLWSLLLIVPGIIDAAQ